MVHNGFEPSFVVNVKSKLCLDPIFIKFKESALKKSVEALSQRGDGLLRYQVRLCELNVDELREYILKGSHYSRCSIHPGFTKMWYNLWEVY